MNEQDRQWLRRELKDIVTELMEGQNEKYLTGEELCKQFGMFTPEFLKRYGHSLPRTAAMVTDEQGETHRTRWSYPQHRIARMISTGEIKNLRCLSVRR